MKQEIWLIDGKERPFKIFGVPKEWPMICTGDNIDGYDQEWQKELVIVNRVHIFRNDTIRLYCKRAS